MKYPGAQPSTFITKHLAFVMAVYPIVYGNGAHYIYKIYNVKSHHAPPSGTDFKGKAKRFPAETQALKALTMFTQYMLFISITNNMDNYYVYCLRINKKACTFRDIDQAWQLI